LLGLLLWPIGLTGIRRDRISLWIMRLVWLGWTIVGVGQLVNVYPRTASFGYAVTSLATGLAVWIVLAGSIVVQRRTRVVLLGLGLVMLVIALTV
jgi:hypothetical protein